MKRDLPPEAVAAARKPRGRPRSFDRERALDAAMEVFWEKGYESASISDLTKAMDINPPSLYAAFGDKDQLFLAAIERYTKARQESCPYWDEDSARGAIESLLTYMANELSSGGHPKGCMMMMAVATSANASPALQKAIEMHRSFSREKLRARLRKGVQDGEIPPDTDVSALADFYGTILVGMSMQARTGASRKSLLATVEQAMRIFPEPPSAAKRGGTKKR